MGDQIIISIVSGIAIVIILGIIKIIKDKADTNKIIKYLTGSLKTTEHTFRSNHAISSGTNLSEERVRNLCSKSKTIKRNTNKKESWQLANKQNGNRSS